jgi:hypothetical protein
LITAKAPAVGVSPRYGTGFTTMFTPKRERRYFWVAGNNLTCIVIINDKPQNARRNLFCRKQHVWSFISKGLYVQKECLAVFNGDDVDEAVLTHIAKHFVALFQ